MKTLQKIAALFLTVLIVGSCTSYEPNEYGPIDFEITLEGPFFEGSIAEGIVTLPFKPEDYNIKRENIYSMIMKEIEISTDAEGGFGLFENVVFTVMTDNTKTKEVASKKIKSKTSSLKINGLKEAEIEGFKDTKEFHLEMMGITKNDMDLDAITIKGKLTMNVMTPQK
jgi:hypothetical protein